MADPTREEEVAAALRTPRAAAVAGLVFAAVMGSVIVLMRLAGPLQGDPTDWVSDTTRRSEVQLAIALVPYAGIAFLWFIGVIRDRLGPREDKLFATVFLGSGLLFVALLFAGAATIGAVLVLYATEPNLPSSTAHLGSALSAQLLTTFAIRMAAVFSLVTTNLGRRSGLVPRWLFWLGIATGLVLLVVPVGIPWAILVFPSWVAVLSGYVLVVADERLPAA